MKKNPIAFTIVLTMASMQATAQNDALFVWRAQVKITVGHGDHAGTDDPVYCALKKGNRTAFDYPRNDFPKNSIFAYDLVLGDVDKLSEIEFLRIYKSKTDGLYLKAVELYLNETLVFDTLFSNGRWLDEKTHGQELMIDGTTLRSHPKWQDLNFQKSFESLREIKEGELKSIICATFGTLMSGNELTWGPEPEVSIARENATTLACKVKASAVVPIFGNLDMTVRFKIVVCENGKPAFIIRGKDGQELERAMKSVTKTAESLGLSGCYKIKSNGDLVFEESVNR